MLKRKFYDKLLAWKQKSERKPLLVRGARQIGKTFIIEEFGRNEYAALITLNFLKNPEYAQIFSGALDADTILSRLTLMVRSPKIIPGSTLLFLDEIQECGDARTSLKFLASDDRFDVIASGSLLGIQYKKVKSVPVGFEEPVTMHSLDFEEFLWAKGYDSGQIAALKEKFERREKIDDFVNETFHREIRDYMVLGGMPEVVSAFCANKDYGEAYDIQKRIVSDYLDDILNYAPDLEKSKVKNCFLSIPRQLARESENRKFKYAEVEKGVGARKYGNSVEWLRDSSIADMSICLTAPLLPLRAYVDTDIFKLYLSDVGLLTAMYGYETKAAIVNRTISGSVKGALYENLISTMLVRRGYDLLYIRDKHDPLEVEFVIEKSGAVIPIEVKASNSSTASLDRLLKRDDIPYGYKFIDGNVGTCGKKVSLPHYLAMFV